MGDTQAYGDKATNDMSDTQEENNLTQLENNPKEYGSATNPEGQRRSHWIARDYHDGQIHFSYRGNPYLLSPRGLLAYDSGHGPGERENGVALFTTSKKLIGAYVDRIAHIKVSPELLAKVSKEDIDAYILGIIMV